MAEPGRSPLRRLAKAKGMIGLFVAFLTGVSIAAGQVPYSVYWLGFPGLCFALYLGLMANSAGQAAGRGMGIGLGFGVVTFVWIVEPFLVDIGRHGWMAPFALFFMAGGVGLFWAMAYWAARRLIPAGGPGFLLVLPVLLTAVELLRSYALTGFPWGLTSYIWIDTPIYQMAAYLGPHGLSLLTLLLAAVLVAALINKNVPMLVVGIVTLVALWSGGSLALNKPVEQQTAHRPMLRLIQPNARQDQKWDPAMMPVFYNRQLGFTAQVSDSPLDLIIWPEVAIPFLLNDPDGSLWEISGAANDVPVIIGAQRFENGQAFNSLAVLGNGGQVGQIYDKHHLVPFGEYLPGGDLLRRLGLKALAAQYGTGYSAGPRARVLDLQGLGQVLPLICYEAIFPHELRRVSTRPDWMLMLTNDAWFGQASGPFQHLAQARARAIELALPMVRAANTGVSAVIDARGQIVQSIPLGQSGYLDVALPSPLSATLYWRFGDLPTGLMLAVLLLTVIGRKRWNSIDPSVAQG